VTKVEMHPVFEAAVDAEEDIGRGRLVEPQFQVFDPRPPRVVDPQAGIIAPKIRASWPPEVVFFCGDFQRRGRRKFGRARMIWDSDRASSNGVRSPDCPRAEASSGEGFPEDMRRGEVGVVGSDVGVSIKSDVVQGISSRLS